MRNLIIGYGQIGQAVHQVIKGDTSIYDVSHNNNHPPSSTDVLHICFPFSDTFIEDVLDYIAKYEPSCTVIWSTVPIGTTRLIPNAVHSPVESRHPELSSGMRFMPRWIGANTLEDEEFFVEYFQDLGLTVRTVGSSDYTEALKLLSTTEYGINIVFADYKKRIADSIGMDFALTKEWNTDYNELYQELGLGHIFQKFVLDAPNGKIGGHCVRENARLLQEQYPDDMVKRIGDMG